MQTPPEIEFQGMTGTPQIEDAIEKHVAELEQRWGRITACRVVLKGPGQHHRTSGLYEVVRLDPSGEFGFLETSDGDNSRSALGLSRTARRSALRQRKESRCHSAPHL